MKEAIKQYGVIIKDVQKDIEEAESFKRDLMNEYEHANSTDDLIKIQSMVLKRQKREYEEAYEKAYEKSLQGE